MATTPTASPTPALDHRKAAILNAVVSEYIETAQPVGSAHITGNPGVEVSSATVRSEMAALERDGYLAQPHTSAGRIPTDKGYRFFVDHLGRPGTLGPHERHEVRKFFAHVHGEVEDLLGRTSGLLAGLTDYAAVVVGPRHESATIRSVQLVGLSPRLALLVVVLSDGAVEKRTVDLPADTSDDMLAEAAGAPQRARAGWDPRQPGHRPGVAGRPCAQRGDRLRCRRARRARRRGRARPRLRGRVVAHGVGVRRGGDGPVGALDPRAATRGGGAHRGHPRPGVVGGHRRRTRLRTARRRARWSLAPVAIEGEVAGTIGVVGPTRMHYPRALAAVELVGEQLGRAPRRQHVDGTLRCRVGRRPRAGRPSDRRGAAGGD